MRQKLSVVIGLRARISIWDSSSARPKFFTKKLPEGATDFNNKNAFTREILGYFVARCGGSLNANAAESPGWRLDRVG